MAKDALQVVISGGHGDLAQAVKKEFEQVGDEVHAPGRQEMDVRDEAAVDVFFAKLAHVDVLIANAGLTRDGALTGLSGEAIGEVIDTNLRGAFFCARAALKPMLRQRSGHILLIGSRSARSGPRGQTAYATAKAGLIGLGQSLAREYGARNIRCNIVLPGFLETRMTRGLPTARRDEILAEHALGHFNTVENAARFIAFLARLEHVSGQIFTLDSRIDRWA